MLELDHVSYYAGNKALLEGVGLALCSGEVLAVLGANGAGKTTLLRLMSGELSPSKGHVCLNDRLLGSFTPEALAARRAVLAQHSSLSFCFSALEVVLLGRTPFHTKQAENLSIAVQAMRVVGVDHLVARNYQTLSGGEQQRVHLARALAQLWNTPNEGDRYLLLDEPTASLDPAHQHRILKTARQAAARGIGVLAVLHDLNLAAQYADRIALMHGGHLLAEGSPRAVLTPELMRRTFDIQVHITEHPCSDCPLIVPIPEGAFDIGGGPDLTNRYTLM